MSNRLQAIDMVAKYLGIRDYSELELRQRLIRKEYSQEEIEEALEEAKKRKWLLPPEELSKKVAEKLHKKAKSYRYIAMYLQSKGLPSVAKDEDLEYKKAKALVNKKFSFTKNISLEDKKKIYRYLRNRSFDESIIRAVSNEFE